MTNNRMTLSTISIVDIPAWEVQAGSVILLPSVLNNTSTIERWIVDEIQEVGDDVILRGEAPTGMQEVTTSRSNLVTVLRQIGPFF